MHKDKGKYAYFKGRTFSNEYILYLCTSSKNDSYGFTMWHRGLAKRG